MSGKRIIISEVQALSLAQHIQNEADTVDLIPTDAQKEAGNYKMGHIRVKGMRISIENPKFSYRVYTNDDGTKGYNKMNHHYGYFGKSKGKDGDAVDVFIGDNIEDFDKVYVVDQNNKDGNFDESKVMLGFNSKKEAYKAYMSNYEEGWTGFRAITSVPIAVFKKWLYRGRKQRQPFADYVAIKKKQLEENKKSSTN